MKSIDIALLGFLIDDEKHGYELFKDIADIADFGQIYSVKIGRLYSVLNRMETERFISSRVDSEGNRPPKKIFKINEKGLEAFNNWMSEPIQHGRDIRINFLVKLYFSREGGFFPLEELIKSQINECKSWLDFQDRKIEKIHDKEKFEYIVRQFRKSQIEGYINWLNWCKRSLIND